MANPHHHAVSSQKQWGGVVKDYLPIHEWFDESKAHLSDFRHRALRHHTEGIFLCESIFGNTITLSAPCEACGGHGYMAVDSFGGHGTCAVCDGSQVKADAAGRKIPVRWIGEQHVREDLGRIPTAADWLRCIKPEEWMNRSQPLSREQEREGWRGEPWSSGRPSPHRAVACPTCRAEAGERCKDMDEDTVHMSRAVVNSERRAAARV